MVIDLRMMCGKNKYRNIGSSKMQQRYAARRFLCLSCDFQYPVIMTYKQCNGQDHELYAYYDGGEPDFHTVRLGHHKKSLTVLRHDNLCTDPFRQFHADSVLKE